MQAVASTVCVAAAAGSALQCGKQQRVRSSLAGRQLRRAASNGSRCRAFFKFGKKDDKASSSGVSVDLGEELLGASRAGQGPLAIARSVSAGTYAATYHQALWWRQLSTPAQHGGFGYK